MTNEQIRLQEAKEQKAPWKKWGPYLSERQWGTVREDYSEGGDAWNYFSHDQARSRAYRWGEDGLAGISDDKQRLCFAVALWNGKDPILKERLFGLTNSESNHGEDVKEYYFYLDSTPTHSYMKYLYKYPQAAVSIRRSRRDQPPPWPPGNGVRVDRYRRVRSGSLLRRLRRVRQGFSGRHPDSGHGAQSRSGTSRIARSADALVPQPVVLACQPRQTDPRSGRRRAGAERREGGRSQPGRALPVLRRRRAPAVHGKRNQYAADLRRGEPDPLRQGQHQRLRRQRPGSSGQSGEKGNQGGGPLSPDGESRPVPGGSAATVRGRTSRPPGTRR